MMEVDLFSRHGKAILHCGDSRDVLKTIETASIDSVVTDPPYALAFMGKAWDSGETAFRPEFWTEVLRVLKPGGHLLAASGTRTYHRLAVAVEDAGFEIRDQIQWIFGSGFPKSHNVNKKLEEIGASCACGHDQLRGVWNGTNNADGMVQADQGPNVLPAVQRGAPRGGVGQARTQGSGGTQDALSDVRGEKPGMEGWRDAPQEAGELCLGEISSVPARVRGDGADGRLCDGTSFSDGEAYRSSADTDGMRASRGSCAIEQLAQQSGALAGQSKSQDGGARSHCGRCGKPIVPDGLGTALKPACEPWVLARKPLVGKVAANVLAYGTGSLNIEGCRVGTTKEVPASVSRADPGNSLSGSIDGSLRNETGVESGHNPNVGRWPANVIHDGSDEVVGAFPTSKDGVAVQRNRDGAVHNEVYGAYRKPAAADVGYGGEGSAARFFYCAKASKADRAGSKHPTVKPLALMRYLCRLITPPGGIVLDPFAGTGTTGEAAIAEGFTAVLIERELEYQEDIRRRLSGVL